MAQTGDHAHSRHIVGYLYAQAVRWSSRSTISFIDSSYFHFRCTPYVLIKKGTGSPYAITERRVPELIPVLGSQPAGDVSHKPGGRLPVGRQAALPTLFGEETLPDVHLCSE